MAEGRMRGWPFRIALSKLRPFNAATITRTLIVAGITGAFLYGDYKLFDRLFGKIKEIETATPFFGPGWTATDLQRLMYDDAIGRGVTVRVQRGSRTLDLEMTPVELPG